MNAPVTIGGICAPDSELARKAAALAERAHTKPLLHHVHRSWWFAALLGQRHGMKYDREALYVASIFHDLGLSEEYMADKRFEVDGADAASGWLKEQGYSDERAALVWQAIALHSSAGIADYMAPEIVLLCWGAHMDVFGLHFDQVTPSLIDDTVQLYPRLGMKDAFTAALAEVTRRKPLLAMGTGLVDVGTRHVHGFSCVNGCDMIQAAPFES